MITRAIGHEHAWPWLWSLDEWLLRRVPATRRWARYVVMAYEA
jgi:hypothetical protein